MAAFVQEAVDSRFQVVPVGPSWLHRDRPKGRSWCFDGCLATPPASDYPLGSEIPPPIFGVQQAFCSSLFRVGDSQPDGDVGLAFIA